MAADQNRGSPAEAGGFDRSNPPLPTIVQHSGVHDVWTIGILSTAPFVIGVVAQQWIARRSDLHDERRWHAAGCAFVSAGGWFALPFVAGNVTESLIALVLAAAGTFAAMAPFWSMPALYLGRKAAAGGIALISTLAGLVGPISPVIIGWLNDLTKTMAAGQFYLAGLMSSAESRSSPSDQQAKARGARFNSRKSAYVERNT